MPNIKQIITPDNTAYDIKDSAAVSNITYNTTNSPALQKTINDTTTTVETPDTTPTSGSKHLITSGAVYSTVGDINTILENIIDGTTLIEKSITANGTYAASSDNADGYSSVTVNVPNTYAAGDEGKVVSNGALVAQGSDTVTENGTVDTTLISSLLVNVSGGGGAIYKLTNPASVTGTNSEFYVAETENYFYFFGRVYFNSISSGNALFTFPEGFDISKIGAFIRAIRLLESNNSTVSAAAYTFDTQNRTAQIYLYKEWGDYVAVYNKSI